VSVVQYVLLAPAVVFGVLVILFVTVSPPVFFAWAVIDHDWAMLFPTLALWAASWGITAVVIYEKG